MGLDCIKEIKNVVFQFEVDVYKLVFGTLNLLYSFTICNYHNLKLIRKSVWLAESKLRGY